MTDCRWAIRIGWTNGSIFHYVSTDEAQAWHLRIHLISSHLGLSGEWSGDMPTTRSSWRRTNRGRV